MGTSFTTRSSQAPTKAASKPLPRPRGKLFNLGLEGVWGATAFSSRGPLEGKNQPRGLKYINWIQARLDLQLLLAKVCDRCCFPVLNAIILETLESQVQLGINGATTEKTYPTCQKDDAGSKIILAISTNRMCVGYVKFAFGWVIAPRDEVSEWGHGPSFEGAVNKAILWPRPDGSAGTQVVPVLSCKAYL